MTHDDLSVGPITLKFLAPEQSDRAEKVQRTVWINEIPHAEFADGTIMPYIAPEIRGVPSLAHYCKAFDEAVARGDETSYLAAIRGLVTALQGVATKLGYLEEVREASKTLRAVDGELDQAMGALLVLELARKAYSHEKNERTGNARYAIMALPRSAQGKEKGTWSKLELPPPDVD